MNGGGLDGECRECRDGTWECGIQPCAGGGGGAGPWRFQGTAWLPIEIGLDAAIRVYTRVEFEEEEGEIVYDEATGDPSYRVHVRLDMPTRRHCIRKEDCPEPED